MRITPPAEFNSRYGKANEKGLIVPCEKDDPDCIGPVIMLPNLPGCVAFPSPPLDDLWQLARRQRTKEIV